MFYYYYSYQGSFSLIEAIYMFKLMVYDGSSRGISIAPWRVCIMLNDEINPSFINTSTHNNILDTTWVTKCLEVCFAQKVLFLHNILMTQRIARIKRSFGLCDIISCPCNFQVSSIFIIESIQATWEKVYCFMWFQMLGRQAG